MKRSHVLAFILIATLIATFHAGVRFAVIDQQAQLPVIYRQLDPSLFSRDFMYQATSAAFGPRFFVNLIFAFLARLFPMEAVTIAGVLLINFLMLWLTYRVAEKYFSESHWTPLIAVAFAGALGNSIFPFASLITSELDPRAMGMPIALLTLWLALRNRPIWCSIAGLVGSLIHPLLLINVMAIALIGMGVRWIVGVVTRSRFGSDKPGRDFLHIAIGGSFFCVASYFLWMVGYDISSLDNKTLFELIQFRTPRYYAMWQFWGPRPFIHYGLFTLAAIWSWVWWQRNRRNKRRETLTVLGMIIGTSLMLAGAVVFVEFIPVRLWLSIDASSGVFITRWLGLILIASTLAQMLEQAAAGQKSAYGSSLILMGGTGTAMPVSMLWGHVVEATRRRWNDKIPTRVLWLLMIAAVSIAVFLWSTHGSLRQTVGLVLLGLPAVWFGIVKEYRCRAIVPLAVAAVLTVMVFTLNGRVAQNELFRATSMFHQVFSLKDVGLVPDVGKQYAAMVDVGEFAYRRTPKDALFLTPPIGSLFRISAKRSVAIDFKGMPGRPAKMLEWRQRLKDCYGPWAKTGFDAIDEMDRNYRGMSREKLAELRDAYGLDYAVLFADGIPAGVTALYQNQTYALVDVRQLEKHP